MHNSEVISSGCADSVYEESQDSSCGYTAGFNKRFREMCTNAGALRGILVKEFDGFRKDDDVDE